MKTFLILFGFILTLALLAPPKSSHAVPPWPKPVTKMTIILNNGWTNVDDVRYTKNKNGKEQYLINGIDDDATGYPYTIVVNINPVGKKGLGLVNCIANGTMWTDNTKTTVVACLHRKQNSKFYTVDEPPTILTIDVSWGIPPCD